MVNINNIKLLPPRINLINITEINVPLKTNYKPVFGGGQTMNNKIVKYEIQLAVPSNLVSQHLKKFTNLLQTTINKAQPMKNTEFISVKIIK